MTESYSQPMVIDAADPRSLAQILPNEMATLVTQIEPRLLLQDEITLTTLIDATQTQKRIKIQFWDEYEAAIKDKRNIFLPNVIFGVCTREYFMEFLTHFADRRGLAWLLMPRPSYSLRVAELIEKGLDQIEQIFLMTANSKNEIGVRNLQLAALRMLDMRKHGGYTQRTENKSLTLTKDLDNNPQSSIPIGEGSIEELEAQVRELESKIASGKNQNGALLDVSHTVIATITPRTDDGSNTEESTP